GESWRAITGWPPLPASNARRDSDECGRSHRLSSSPAKLSIVTVSANRAALSIAAAPDQKEDLRIVFAEALCSGRQPGGLFPGGHRGPRTWAPDPIPQHSISQARCRYNDRANTRCGSSRRYRRRKLAGSEPHEGLRDWCTNSETEFSTPCSRATSS